MNYKETKAPVTTITYDKDVIEAPTENIYEAISIVSRRAEQINSEIKKELIETFDICWSDNTKARILNHNQNNLYKENDDIKVRSQFETYNYYLNKLQN